MIELIIYLSICMLIGMTIMSVAVIIKKLLRLTKKINFKEIISHIENNY